MAQPPVSQSRDAASPTLWDERFTHEHTPQDAAGVPVIFRQFHEAQPAPSSILIPGCGNAYEAGRLIECGQPVAAIDSAPSAVVLARAMLGLHVGVVQLADLFRFSPPRPVYWIYRHTFLCVMLRRLWSDYATQVVKLLPPRGLLTGPFAVAEGREAIPKGPSSEAMQPELDVLLPPTSERISDMPIAEIDSIPAFAGHERWQVWRRRAD